MGYSIFVVPKNKELYEKMHDFIMKNYKPLDQIISNENNYLRGPENDLSYTGHYKKFHYIGFDYGAGVGEFERAYAFRLCNWMALKCSKTKKINGKQVNYIVYDGYEKYYVSTDPTSQGAKYVEIVNEHGFKEYKTFFGESLLSKALNFFYRDLKKFNQEVEKELQRLSKLWENE